MWKRTQQLFFPGVLLDMECFHPPCGSVPSSKAGTARSGGAQVGIPLAPKEVERGSRSVRSRLPRCEPQVDLSTGATQNARDFARTHPVTRRCTAAPAVPSGSCFRTQMTAAMEVLQRSRSRMRPSICGWNTTRCRIRRPGRTVVGWKTEEVDALGVL